MIRYKLLKAQLTGTIYPQQVESQSFTQKDMNEALKKRFGSIAPEYNRFAYTTTNATSYKMLTGCTGYTARKELKQFVAEGKLRRIPARRIKLYTLSSELIQR